MKTAPNGGLGAVKKALPCEAFGLPPSGRRSTYHHARRVGNSREVAAAVLYLASADASYTTGAVLKVDGGIL